VSVLSLNATEQNRDDGIITRGRSPPLTQEEPILQQPTMSQRREELGQSPTISESTLEERQDTPEESEEEYSDDEEPDDNEILNFRIEGPEPFRRMVLHLAQQVEEMFPKIQGKRRLHPHQFDLALTRLRAMFWNYRLVNVDYDAQRYVQEVPPLGSTFSPTGGYTAPDGIGISKEMRKRVTLIRQRFGEIQRIQEAWQEEEITNADMQQQVKRNLMQWIVPIEIYPMPTWKGQVLQDVKISTVGQVHVSTTNDRVTLTPKLDGALNWSICLERTQTTKN